jgi:hypothetical protein
MRRHLIAATLTVGALALAAPARAADERIELPTRPGVTERVLLTPPEGPPVASLILFTGGDGMLFGRDSAGQLKLKGLNFLIRSRQKFAAAGFLVASVDVPSDHPTGYETFRGSADHARDVAILIAWLRQKAPVPVWLVGTSNGTISAANAAARLKTGGPDGLVMTSSIVAQTRLNASVQSVVAVEEITQPTLFVHNKDDACVSTPFSYIAALMDRFTHARKKELIAVSGGSPPEGNPCEPLSRHGYIGLDDEVVGDIARWIKGG